MLKYITILLLLISCGGGDSTSSKVLPPTVQSDKELLIVAHRGLQENILNGFKTAIDEGFLVLETDIRLRSGGLVLLHDDTLCGTCTTLKELLELVDGTGITLWLEFKESEAILPTLDLLSEYNIDVMLSSFKKQDVVYLNSVSNYDLGYLSYKYDPEMDFVDWYLVPDVKECVNHIKCGIWTIKNQQEFDLVAGYDVVDAIVVDRF